LTMNIRPRSTAMPSMAVMRVADTAIIVKLKPRCLPEPSLMVL
jgi:hypothetical protein